MLATRTCLRCALLVTKTKGDTRPKGEMPVGRPFEIESFGMLVRGWVHAPQARRGGRLQRPPTAACGSPDLLRRWQLLDRLLGSLERLLRAFVQNKLIALGRDFAQLAHHGAGSGRDQPPDDDVLLQAVQRIDLAVDRRLGENPGGLLERCRRNERAGLERGLGDAEENRIAV